MNSLEVIVAISQATPDIRCFSFHEIPEQRLVQESDICWGENEQYMFEHALVLKRDGMPFWDGIMLSTFNNPYYSKVLLQQALHHNSHPKLTFVLKKELFRWFNKQSNAINRFALCSRVIMEDEEELHLPLIDFHIPVSKNNVNVVEFVCKLLGLGEGWILDSGKSYHFIGLKPFCYDDLVQLLYKSLMFTPIIDKAWISHQLREHSCSLRIGEKRGKTPVVVKKL